MATFVRDGSNVMHKQRSSQGFNNLQALVITSVQPAFFKMESLLEINRTTPAIKQQ